jgi:biotin-(acetyl-CoA carboxylase) ligase
VSPNFPPLMQGEAVVDRTPLAHGIARAKDGVDAGLIPWSYDGFSLSAALVLAPETPLEQALGAVLAVGNGFADAFGVAAPPELPLHLDWPGGFRVNGATCGGLRFAASTATADTIPDWLVIGFDLPFRRAEALEPGRMPDTTVLHEEGCGVLEPLPLLEAWARHALHWLNRMEGDGMAPIHRDWLGRAWARGETITRAGITGTFTGLDEWGGLLVTSDGRTRTVPLAAMLETP